MEQRPRAGDDDAPRRARDLFAESGLRAGGPSPARPLASPVPGSAPGATPTPTHPPDHDPAHGPAHDPAHALDLDDPQPAVRPAPPEPRTTPAPRRRALRWTAAVAAAAVVTVVVVLPQLGEQDAPVTPTPTSPPSSGPVDSVRLPYLGENPALVVGPDPWRSSTLSVGDALDVGPLPTDPSPAWSFTFRDAIVAMRGDGAAVSQEQKSDAMLAKGASMTLPTPAAGGMVSTSDVVVVHVVPGLDELWEGFARLAPSLGGGNPGAPPTGVLMGLSLEEGTVRWARSVTTVDVQPCHDVGRGAVVVCQTGTPDAVTSVVLEARTGDVITSFSPRGCTPSRFLRDRDRFYWAGTGPRGACLGGGTSGAVLGVVPDVSDLEADALTLTVRGPMLRTRTGSIVEVDGEWHGYDGWVEPGPQGVIVLTYDVADGIVTHLPDDVRPGSELQEPVDGTPVTRSVTTLMTVDGAVLTTVEGRAWRRLDLSTDATPTDGFDELAGAGTGMYDAIGMPMARSREIFALPASFRHGTRLTLTPVGLTAEDPLDGTVRSWSPGGSSESSSRPVFVAAVGDQEIVTLPDAGVALTRSGSVLLPGLQGSTQEGGIGWSITTHPDAVAGGEGPSATDAPAVHSLRSGAIVVREPNGVAAHR